MKWILLIAAFGLCIFFFRVPSKENQEIASVYEVPQTVTMLVKGMTCSHCARSITTVLERDFDAKEVVIDVEGGDVSFLSERKLDKAAVENSVESLGFEVKTIEIQPHSL